MGAVVEANGNLQLRAHVSASYRAVIACVPLAPASACIARAVPL
jgi:hypothetical protein